MGLAELLHLCHLVISFVPTVVVEDQHQTFVLALRKDGSLDVFRECQEVGTISALVHLEVAGVTETVADGPVDSEVRSSYFGGRDLDLEQVRPSTTLGLP